MLDTAVRRIDDFVADADTVLDVGGWANPLPRADWIIDLFPWETRGLYGSAVDPSRERFTDATWVRHDICENPWPFADDQFDFVVCAQTLEDVRDPLAVCRELARVGKAGYVEVPSPVEELTWGLQGPWAGWSHHHWICELHDAGLRFTHKSHSVHAPGRHLPAGSCDALPPQRRVLELWWRGSFPAREQVFVGAEQFDPWLEGLLAAAGTHHPPSSLLQGAATRPPSALRRVQRALARRRRGLGSRPDSL